MELQRGVVGDRASIPDLAEEVAAAWGARRRRTPGRPPPGRAGVPVVHCTAEFRPDREGSAINAPLLAVMAKRPTHLLVGSPEAEVVPELGPDPGDLVVPRRRASRPSPGPRSTSRCATSACARSWPRACR